MSSVHADYLLKNLKPGHPSLSGLEPHGTRVRLRIRSSVDFKERSMLDIVRYWIILPACELLYFEKGKEQQPIGFNTPSEALNYFYLKDSPEKIESESSYEILKLPYIEGNEKYELAFAVRKGFTPEKNFISMSMGKPAPAVCIEGIRADNALPGFTMGLCALLSSRGNKRFRTTVSRTNLEEDEEYIRVGEICTKLLFDHLENEVNRISEQKGKPLSQASTAGLWIYKSLSKTINDQRLRNYADSRYSRLPVLVIEIMESEGSRIKTSRKLISPEQLNKMDRFWTIESRLVDYIGFMSRDLGRELSLNEFLGTLAPEFQDSRITPVVSDAHQFGHLILSSHTVANVEFSREHQQTLVEWRLKKDHVRDATGISDLVSIIGDPLSKKLWEKIDIILSKRARRGGLYPQINATVIAPLKGDMTKVWGINTRVITILEPKSRAAEVLAALNEAILILSKETKLEELSIVCTGGILFSTLCKTAYRGKLESLRMHGDFYPLWGEIFSEISSIFANIGIDKQIPENLSDFENDIHGEGIMFNASSYWMDWIKGEYEG